MASTIRLLVGRSSCDGESSRSAGVAFGFNGGAGAAEAQRASSLGTACRGLVLGRFASCGFAAGAAEAEGTPSSLVSVPCPLGRALTGVGGRSCLGPGTEGEESDPLVSPAGEVDSGDGEVTTEGVYGSRVT